MDVQQMLSNGTYDAAAGADSRKQNHQHTARHGTHSHESHHHARPASLTSQRSARNHYGGSNASGHSRASPTKKDQKQVIFQLVDPGDPKLQARLPMRVMLSPKDTTESIITTVKNFWGLYEHGVSFENKEGISIIATFDNFDHDMTVYVRTVPLPPSVTGEHARDSASPVKPTLGAPFEMRPTLHGARSPSRSAARSAGARSVSPQSELDLRSVSAAPGTKSRSQRKQSRDTGALGDGEGYSSGIDDQGSVTSSRRSKAEEIKAEITVDNIVEGGRRKRMFESSELPLFVPPQIPISASISSTSPQRRTNHIAASPYAFSNQQTFSYQHPLPSPQSFVGGSVHTHNGFPSNPYQSTIPRPMRGARSSGASYSSHHRHSGGILPTPDPTVGSVISDEDVALQLMRLGDPAAFSHGRTSTSTYDDALSGKADAASSCEGSSADEDEEDDVHHTTEGKRSAPTAGPPARGDSAPQRKKQRLMNDLPSDATSADEYEDRRDAPFNGENHGARSSLDTKSTKVKSKSRISAVPNGASIKSGKPRAPSMSKPKKPSMPITKAPMSPASLASQSRKASVGSTINFQNQLGPNEEDLSSKPRCQRCRKSKKGCDRQRPCGRCKDAGIGVDGCVSEDEGNGRKGRYGRHMNIPIKKDDEVMMDGTEPPVVHQHPSAVPANGYFLAPALPDKSKKRKK